jgi:DNA-directed RNA polymerase III subunit RPC1
LLKRRNLQYLQKKALKKRIHEKAKKNNICFNCSEFNGNFFISFFISKYLIFLIGVVKKCGLLKIQHDKFKANKKNEPLVKDYVESFFFAKEYNKEIEPLISKSHEILSPLKVLDLFKEIPEEVILFETLFFKHIICLLLLIIRIFHY